MGCNSDHMNPTAREVNSSKTARNLAYAHEKMGMSIPDSVSSAAQSYYGNASLLNEFTVALCDLCRSMSDEQKDSIIINYLHQAAHGRGFAGLTARQDFRPVEQGAKRTAQHH